MAEASYDGVQDHLGRLIGSVRAELDHEAAELDRLNSRYEPRFLSRLLVVDLLLANLLLWLVLSDYALYWITASFFLYVVYPFLFLVPSSTAPAGSEGGARTSGSRNASGGAALPNTGGRSRRSSGTRSSSTASPSPRRSWPSTA